MGMSRKRRALDTTEVAAANDESFRGAYGRVAKTVERRPAASSSPPQTQGGRTMNAVSSNPNASVTAFAGAVTIVAVWCAGAAGLAIPAEVASAFTTIVAAVILWIGRIERSRLGTTPPVPASSQS
jgi:hypothetical protein